MNYESQWPNGRGCERKPAHSFVSWLRFMGIPLQIFQYTRGRWLMGRPCLIQPCSPSYHFHRISRICHAAMRRAFLSHRTRRPPLSRSPSPASPLYEQESEGERMIGVQIKTTGDRIDRRFVSSVELFVESSSGNVLLARLMNQRG